ARILADADAGTADRLTSQSAILGTPDYMAPEQARDTHRVDIRADLYSLGCTAYHLLAGHVPFPGGQPLEKLLRHRPEQPTPLEQVRPDLAPGQILVVGRLLAKDPDHRFQTPAELAHALLPLLPAGLTPLGSAPPETYRLPGAAPVRTDSAPALPEPVLTAAV